MATIQYRGAYRFADRAALDHAVAAAFADRALAAWRDHFEAQGSSLRILLEVPTRRSDQRTVAADVMQTLAAHAIEGIVVARHRELAIDVFVCRA